MSSFSLSMMCGMKICSLIPYHLWSAKTFFQRLFGVGQRSMFSRIKNTTYSFSSSSFCSWRIISSTYFPTPEPPILGPYILASIPIFITILYHNFLIYFCSCGINFMVTVDADVENSDV